MTLLHFVHDAGTSDVPHWPQKRAPFGLIALHCGQVMPLAEGAEHEIAAAMRAAGLGLAQ